MNITYHPTALANRTAPSMHRWGILMCDPEDDNCRLLSESFKTYLEAETKANELNRQAWRKAYWPSE
ncbi:hypothetical protein GCM10007159_03060 [Modicisalibacter luteus]|nr:hypothetical protein GCM10007159_03060 [Halomonas lutea]